MAQQQSVCAVVNTCEYCSETTGQLADTISKQLGEGEAATGAPKDKSEASGNADAAWDA